MACLSSYLVSAVELFSVELLPTVAFEGDAQQRDAKGIVAYDIARIDAALVGQVLGS